MGAAEPCTFTLIGKSGVTYHIDVLSADAVAGALYFNPVGNAATTSPTFFQVPEDCWITDVSITTGTTCTGANLMMNGISIPVQLRWATQLDTNTGRPALRIFYPAGTFISGVTN